MTTATESSAPPNRPFWFLLITVLIAALLLGGTWAVQWRVALLDRTLRDDLLHHATAIARTLSLEEIRSLSFSSTDLEQPSFQRLRDQLTAYQALLNCRGLYTLALRDRDLVFGPESYPEHDPHASPPGTVYEQPTAEVRALFLNRRPFTEGPVSDEYGTFVSAFAPVVSPTTGAVLLAVGIDLEATEWQLALWSERVRTILALVPLGFVLLGGAILLRYRARLPQDRQRALRLVEPCWVAALGLALTLLALLLAMDQATRNRRDTFQQLAQAQAGRLVDNFEELRIHQLGGLARFFAGSQMVDQEEFRVFTAPITHERSVEFVALVRPISAPTANPDEEVRGEKASNGRWSPTAGSPIPLNPEGQMSYPIWFVEPFEGNETIHGMDLGFHPSLSATIQSTIRSSLPTASDPIQFHPSGESASLRVLLFHPLVSLQQGVRSIDGLLMVQLRIDSILRSALSILTSDEQSFDAELFHLDPGQPPRFLASSSARTTDSNLIQPTDNSSSRLKQNSTTALFPLFAFGKSFALRCQPGPAFLAARPWRVAWHTGLGGVSLTLLFTLLTASIVGHRTNLESRVRTRTAALHESERRMTTLFGNLPGMAYRCDPDQDWTMRFASVGSLQLTGYAAGDLIGNKRVSFASLVHPDDRPRLWQTVQQSLQRSRTFTIEYRILPACGPEKWVWEQGCAIPDANGHIEAIEGFITEITQRKLLEDQFRQAQKMEAIGRLAGGVAHDFNNILAVILMNTSFLRTDPQLSEEQLDGLDQVALAAERGANLTRQLLSFSRRQVVQTRPLDLNDVVSGMARMLQRIIGEDVTLQTRLLPGGAPVHADAGMIEQILLNLAVNARDAMPGGGQLNIHLDRFTLSQSEPIPHPAARPGDFILLTVQDTGSGIAPDLIPHLFEPFFTTKEVGKGTGLGLATVHGIVDQHRGWITVQSQLNHGSSFLVHLPRLQDQEALRAEQETTLRIRGGGETILLVEDEPALRLLAGQALKNYGYRVIEAPTGAVALELWNKQPKAINLLLTDMVMPGGISGPQLASRLKARQPDLKVIFVSGYPGEIAGQGVELKEGANFLQKPFDPIQLAQIVRHSLDQPPTTRPPSPNPGPPRLES
jgi:PAS domain S-box-containing protein